MPRNYLLAVAILGTQFTPANAQDYELTPFMGWRTSSSLEEVSTGATINLDETSSYGFILSMKKSPDTNYDFLFSRQDTELQSSTTPSTVEPLRIDYYHLGGTIFYDYDKLHPFVSGGLGATHITPATMVVEDVVREGHVVANCGARAKRPEHRVRRRCRTCLRGDR